MAKAKHRDKGHRASASQFFVAGELSRRGVIAVVTTGNCPNTDILCSNKAGTKFAHIQVKTFKPGGRTCSVGAKAERKYGESFFWVLGGIPEPKSKSLPIFYVIPNAVMCNQIRRNHKLWLRTPGVEGQKHNDTTIRTVHLPPRKHRNGWSVEEYEDRWDLILKALR